jgi:hypothetical protein
MSSKATSEGDIWDLINAGWDRMSIPQRNLWEVIKVSPAKWQEPTYGKHVGGFWIVGIVGQKVIWYNDIEDGFNLSKYSELGTISEYWCNQDQLEWTVQNVLNELKSGCPSGGKAGPPRPGKFKG